MAKDTAGEVSDWWQLLWNGHPTLAHEVAALSRLALDYPERMEACHHLVAERYRNLTTVSPSVGRNGLFTAFSAIMEGAPWDGEGVWAHGPTGWVPAPDVKGTITLPVQVYCYEGGRWELEVDFADPGMPGATNRSTAYISTGEIPVDTGEQTVIRFPHEPSVEEKAWLVQAPRTGRLGLEIERESVVFCSQSGGGWMGSIGEIHVGVEPNFDEESIVREVRDALRALRKALPNSVPPHYWREDSYARILRRYTQWFDWAREQRAGSVEPNDTTFCRQVLDAVQTEREDATRLWSLGDADRRKELREAKNWLHPLGDPDPLDAT